MTSLINQAVLALGALLFVVLSWLGYHDATKTEPARMELVSLEYRGGKFVQVHQITGANTIRANWAAKITRTIGGETQFLCAGGGTSIYRDGASPVMTPDYWTGDDCPELQPGDNAVASWEYQDENGLIRRIEGELSIQ